MRLILRQLWLLTSAQFDLTSSNQTFESQISGEFLCGWRLFNGISFSAESSSEVVGDLNTSPTPKKENQGTLPESKQTDKEMKRKTKGFKPKRGLMGKRLADQKL